MKSLVIFILAFAASQLAGQKFVTRQYGMDDGLPHPNVFSAYQDSRGFLWFSTNFGLCRYDGQHFISYNQFSLLRGAIISLSEPENNDILVSTISQGPVQLRDSAIFTLIQKRETNFNYTLYSDKVQNTTWTITHKDGLTLYKIRGQVCTPVILKDDNQNLVVFERIRRIGTQLYATSSNGLYLLAEDTLYFLSPGGEKARISDIARDKYNLLWIARSDRIQAWKSDSMYFEHRLEPGQTISSLLLASNDELWFSLYGDGVYRIVSGKLENITEQLNLNSTLINHLFQDFASNIWISTYDAGVFRVMSPFNLRHFSSSTDQNSFVRSISSNFHKEIIVGGMGRVFSLMGDKYREIAELPLRKNEYLYFAKSENDTLFLGSPRGLLYITDFHKAPKLFESSKEDIGAICMLRWSKGGTYVGGFNGLYKLNSQFQMRTDTSSPQLQGKRVNVLFEDSKHNIIAGTEKGLFLKTASCIKEISLPGSEGCSRINDIIEDRNHQIWVACDAGLLLLQNYHFGRLYTVEDGLTESKCNCLALDSHQRLWIGGLFGVNYCKRIGQELKIRSISTEAGEVQDLMVRDQDLIVGNNSGLYVYRLDKFLLDEAPPAVYFTAAEYRNQSTRFPTTLELTSSDYPLILHFAAISLHNAYDVLFRYRLEGSDTSWIITRSDVVEFPSLPYGSFKIILSASKSGGPWSKQAALVVNVRVPIWRKTSTLITVFLLSIVLLQVVTSHFLKQREQIKQKKVHERNQRLELQNKMVELRQQAFASMMNPHFIFNCLNSIQYFINRNDNNNANQYLADFAKLIRSTLEDSAKGFIDLESELEKINLYIDLERIRFGDRLKFEVELESSLDARNILIPTMILQPFIENSIWHGIQPANIEGIICLKVHTVSEQYIQLLITDNGVGVSQQERSPIEKEQRKRIGLALTRERLKSLSELTGRKFGYRIFDNKSSESSGTTVEITLPVLKAGEVSS